MSRLFRPKLISNYCEFSSACLKPKNVWTSDRIAKSPYKDVTIPKLTVDEYVWKNLDKWPTKVAAVCGITNRSYTYEEIYKQSRTLGANLRKKLKINNGDAVAVILRNAPEFPIVMFGILAAGGTVTPFNPVYTAHEIQRPLILTESKLIIAHPDIVPNIKKALELSKVELPIVVIDVNEILPTGTISYKELVGDIHVDLSILKECNRAFDDVAFLPSSSGTTGLPKGVELTNMNFVANCEQQNTELRLYSYTTETHQDNALVILPMFHSYGLSILTIHKMSVGIKLITLPKFEPDTFLNSMLAHRINLLYLAPPTVLFLGSHPQVTAKHLEHVSCLVCGAAPLPSADIQRLFEKAEREINFTQGYGLTETGPLVSVSPLNEKNYMEVGYALPNIELRVVDENMKNLGPGEVGELLIKGPNVMKGYKNNPQADSEVFLEGGWLRSGDLAKIDEKGLITISDRIKELIKVKGFQVPPAELENVLREHPHILDAAVIGVPDDGKGERPKAFVVLKESTHTTVEQIIKFVSERVAPYKKINDISFVDSIPKNPSGKILRKVLKEKFC